MSKLMEAQDFASSLRTKPDQVKGPDAIFEDPYFEEDATVSKLIEFSIRNRKHLFIVGPTGCGKSSYVVHLAARLKESIEIFSCSGETSTEELIGKPWITEKNGQRVTVPIYGAAIRAYRDGKILLLEEVDMGMADILACTHRLMEKQSNFYTANIGDREVIQKHLRFMVIATANTIGQGEDTFMYAGTKPLNQAYMNRYNYTYRMDYLPPDKEKKVLMAKTGVDQGTADYMVKVAQEARAARAAAGSGRIASVISTRDLIEWANAVIGMKIDRVAAAEYAFLNRMSDSDADQVRGWVENRTR